MAKGVIKDALNQVVKNRNSKIDKQSGEKELRVWDSQYDKIRELDERVDKFNAGETEGQGRYSFVKGLIGDLQRILGHDPDLSSDDYRKLEKEITFEVRDL
ncbi:hypothetical protein EPO05_00850 [Patescibacteria group bacterium]|nr:MAG: hypothetical protein EPO05_00850 [Patescibacteria group bacterium]